MQSTEKRLEPNRLACLWWQAWPTAATKTTLPGKRPAPESGAKRGRAGRLNRAKNRQNYPFFSNKTAPAMAQPAKVFLDDLARPARPFFPRLARFFLIKTQNPSDFARFVSIENLRTVFQRLRNPTKSMGPCVCGKKSAGGGAKRNRLFVDLGNGQTWTPTRKRIGAFES
jgi:hypothetical protein